jgi:hypothetical protein
MFSFGGKKKSKARDKKKEKGGDKDKEAALGYDEEDGYGEEIYDEGALEMLADEGIDSDIEAEENERYNRRPRPADGPVERSTENGFLARQPCRAALVAPTSHTTGYNTHEKPDHHLQLDFVYGYRAHDSRHNLVYNIDGLVTYPAAATGIAYDSREHTQQFFTMHTDDIVSLAMHPDREIMATGQVGKDPTICVWSSTTCELLAELKGFHQRAWCRSRSTVRANTWPRWDSTTTTRWPSTIGRRGAWWRTARVTRTGCSTASTIRTTGGWSRAG